MLNTFSLNNEGWSIISFNNLSKGDYSTKGTYTPTYNLSGGNSDGYITTSDPDDGYFIFSAPSTFLGNKSNLYNTMFSYDILHTGIINISYPLKPRQ